MILIKLCCLSIQQQRYTMSIRPPSLLKDSFIISPHLQPCTSCFLSWQVLELNGWVHDRSRSLRSWEIFQQRIWAEQPLRLFHGKVLKKAGTWHSPLVGNLPEYGWLSRWVALLQFGGVCSPRTQVWTPNPNVSWSSGRW